ARFASLTGYTFPWWPLLPACRGVPFPEHPNEQTTPTHRGARTPLRSPDVLRRRSQLVGAGGGAGAWVCVLSSKFVVWPADGAGWAVAAAGAAAGAGAAVSGCLEQD